jgi:cell wall-associated NlpC family hydrolase
MGGIVMLGGIHKLALMFALSIAGGPLVATQPADAAPLKPRAVRVAVEHAMEQRGRPYSFGAAGPGAFDCSGLITAAYREAGINLPHSTYSQVDRGRWVSRRDLRPGDLVFTSSEHVQLYVGHGYIIEAANPGTGVIYRKMWGFWTARRIVRW